MQFRDVTLHDLKTHILPDLYDAIDRPQTAKVLAIQPDGDELDTGATEIIDVGRQHAIVGALALHPVVGSWLAHRLSKEIRNPGGWFTKEQIATFFTSTGAIDWTKLFAAIIAALPQILAFIQAIMKMFGL